MTLTGDAYLKTGDFDKAETDYRKAQELDHNLDIQEKLNLAKTQAMLSRFKAEIQSAVETLEIPLTVDNITLGKTSIASAKDAYAGRPYAHSNLMNDDTEDTVYTCFGLDGLAVPEGYQVDEFGFFFGEPVTGGGIHQIFICDSSFTCMGSLHVGDQMDTVLSYFNFPQNIPIGNIEWSLLNGAVLTYTGISENTFSFFYQIDSHSAKIDIENGVIHRITMKKD